MKVGKVYLVGGGPGDAGLLTVKGLKLIESADVVVHDRLISNEIMELIPRDTKLINVGKNVGHHSVPQDEINKILVREAKKGQTVVRLKGGDPFLFGRGGEEIEELYKNNIEFEVVSGVTSSIAAPSYGGIPVTHRDYCSSLHIITGHAKKGGKLNIDFVSLAKLGGTLVFMMSVSTVGQIARGLTDAGMDKNMPCAVVENGTMCSQRTFVSTLENIAETIEKNNVKSPAVIVVGKVCELADKFDWFTKRPLFGRKIIVTQPEKKASKLADILREKGADVTVYPCIKMQGYDDFDTDVRNYNIIVFTSAVGVTVFFESMIERNIDARKFYNKNFACVGKRTADKLKEYGIIADFVPSAADGEHLAKEMLSTGFVSPTDKILLLRAEKSSKEILDIFDKSGLEYCDRAIYKAEYIKHDNLDLSEYDYVMFTSKSTVDGFVKCMNTEDFSSVKAVCIGKKTAEYAKENGFDTIISENATVESMAECVVKNEGDRE